MFNVYNAEPEELVAYKSELLEELRDLETWADRNRLQWLWSEMTKVTRELDLLDRAKFNKQLQDRILELREEMQEAAWNRSR